MPRISTVFWLARVIKGEEMKTATLTRHTFNWRTDSNRILLSLPLTHLSPPNRHFTFSVWVIIWWHWPCRMKRQGQMEYFRYKLLMIYRAEDSYRKGELSHSFTLTQSTLSFPFKPDELSFSDKSSGLAAAQVHKNTLYGSMSVCPKSSKYRSGNNKSLCIDNTTKAHISLT